MTRAVFRLSLGLTTACLGLAAGCTGSIGLPVEDEPGAPGGGGRPGTGVGGGSAAPDLPAAPEDILTSPACLEPSPGPAPLRRLSHGEYANVVRDLLGDSEAVRGATATFVPEVESLGFRNSAALLGVPSLVANQYADAAEKLAAVAARDANLTRCATPSNQTQCASQFIRDFGQRAYRRPLTSEEHGRYAAMFATAMRDYDYATGVEWVVHAMLQSPHFLYRVEHGEPAAAGKAYTRPTAYEMASRLSFLYWQSGPDAELLTAAAQGRLQTPEEVRAQAERLLGDPKAERALEFFRQWLDADTLPTWSRDPMVFRNLPANLKTLFAQETDAFTRHLVLQSEGTLADLYTAGYTFANAELGRYYGLPDSLGSGFTRVQTDRAVGFLTQPAFLTVHDKPYRTSIVLRGVKLRTDIMCELVPAPPNDVELDLGALAANLTQREKLALHRESPACSGCHRLIDPLGLVFENYDAVGKRRTHDEQGNLIDPASDIELSQDLDGRVAGPRELAERFAASRQVSDCYVTQNFRFFYGRDHGEADRCSQARLTKLFDDSGRNLRQMLLALAQTDAFLYRPAGNP